MSTPWFARPMTPPRLYKALSDGRKATYGNGAWPEVGEWTDYIYPYLCERGWHISSGYDILNWMSRELYLAEVAPDAVYDGTLMVDSKIAVSKARLIKRLPWGPNVARSIQTHLEDSVEMAGVNWPGTVYPTARFDKSNFDYRLRWNIATFKQVLIAKRLNAVYNSRNRVYIGRQIDQEVFAIIEGVLEAAGGFEGVPSW